eukprot:TCONS_00003505-protein
MDINIIKKLKVVELKAALGERGLSTKGKKDDLVKRLVEAMEADEEPQQEVENEPEVAEEAMETGESSQQSDSNNQESEDKEAPTSSEQVEQVKEPEIEAPVEEEFVPSSTTQAEPEASANSEAEPSESKTEDATPSDKPAEDWVLVEPPTVDETSAVNDASTKQDEAVKESQETPVPESTSSADVEMKEDKKEETTESKTAKAETDEVKAPEPKKEEPKEEEIQDAMVEVEVEEGEEFVLCEVADGKVGLDQYSSDINLVISNNGLAASPLSKNGFSYLWAGARANRGVKGGKIGYEVKITGKKEVDLPETEILHHAIRIGWSAEHSGMQLGESSSSYGYESTGKVCASSSFYTYGVTFGEGDVIGTYLDLESEPKSLKYTKNGEDLGVAMSLTINLDEKPLFPHILVRNMSVELNFGDNETPFNETPEGFTLLQNGSEEQTVKMTSTRLAEDEMPEVIMMVGLPSSGKTVWVKKYVDSNTDKLYNIVSVQGLLDRCKLEGKSRRKDDKGFQELMTAAIKVLTKLYQLCPKRKRNYIYDQSNVYHKAQIAKMEPFNEFKRKAVIIVPTHDNLRRRTSDAKRKNEIIHEVPFGDLCDMKCRFNIPEKGELFDDVSFPELDEKNATKTVHDYHSDGQRAKRTGRDEYYPKKKGRYEDRRSGDRRQYGSGGGRDYRRDDYNRYGSFGNRRDDRQGDKRRYDDRRNSGGSNYGRQHYGSGGHHRNNSGGYNSGYGQNYGGYGQNYNASGQSYGGYNNYNNYQYGNQAANRGQSWQQGQPQYYVQQQGQQPQQQWGQWGNYYNTGSGSNNYGSGSGYGY